MDQNIDQRKAEWLETVKKITEKCFERDAKFFDLCPQRYSPVDKRDRIAALKAVASLSKDISKQVQRLHCLEKGGGFGFTTVLETHPDEMTTVVLSLLVSARLDRSVAHQMRTVQDVVYQTAVRNPSTSLLVRNLFRSDGVLFRLVSMGRSVVLDEAHIVLRESVLNMILGQANDETEARCEAEALVGRNR